MNTPTTIFQLDPGGATVIAASISAVGLIVGGLAGYLLKYSLDKRKEFASENAETKRRMYEAFVSAIADVMSRSTGDKIDQLEMLQNEFKQSSQKFYKTSVLYGSSEVVRA